MKKIKPLFIIALLILVACEADYKPKPMGYFRFDLPKHEYVEFTSECGYQLDIPNYSKMYPGKEECWNNLFIVPVRGTVHLTHQKITGDINQFLAASQDLVYEHTSKADGIKQSVFENSDTKVYGMLYELIGNAASSVQFYVTDSTDNFLRGALYFNSAPNKDSLAPLVTFAAEDIRHMISSLEWN